MKTRGLVFLAALLLVANGEETEEPAAEEVKTDGYDTTYSSADEEKKKADAKDQTASGGKTRKELAEGHAYCEYDNCYKLLGVEPDAGPIPSARSQRNTARPPRMHV